MPGFGLRLSEGSWSLSVAEAAALRRPDLSRAVQREIEDVSNAPAELESPVRGGSSGDEGGAARAVRSC